MNRTLPAVDELKKLFIYHKETGDLIGRRKGKPIRAIHHGYYYARVGTKKSFVHRIIWKMITGEDLGENFIDHISGDKKDNRFQNLRVATKEQNAHNRRGTTNVLAVGKGWRARVRYQGKQVLSKTFGTKQEALDAVSEVKSKYYGVFSPI